MTRKVTTIFYCPQFDTKNKSHLLQTRTMTLSHTHTNISNTDGQTDTFTQIYRKTYAFSDSHIKK
jgi:hypothetical protein